MRILGAIVLAASLTACSSDKSSVKDAAGTHDAAAHDAGVDAKLVDAKPIDAPSGTPLTVKNFQAWCTVSADGRPTTPALSQTVYIQNPAAITLVAMRKNATFEVSGNMWHHTDGDTGAGEPGSITNPSDPATKTSTATVTVGTTAKCVYVCCPFSGGTGCDGIAEQCP